MRTHVWSGVSKAEQIPQVRKVHTHKTHNYTNMVLAHTHSHSHTHTLTHTHTLSLSLNICAQTPEFTNQEAHTCACIPKLTNAYVHTNTRHSQHAHEEHAHCLNIHTYTYTLSLSLSEHHTTISRKRSPFSPLASI
jgi:hypothetical protein